MKVKLNPRDNCNMPSLRLAVAILVSLTLTACGGGISGTGGGIIVDPNETSVSDGAGDGTGGSSDVATPISSDSDLPLPEVSLILPAALEQASTRNDNISKSQLLTRQLIAVQQEVEALAAQVNGNEIIVDNSTNDGYFDNTLTYSESGTETIIRWSDSNIRRYLFSTNNDRHIYVLQDDLTFTIRRVDLTSNIVLQTNIVISDTGSPDSDTTIVEADINNNGEQLYLRSYSDATNAVVLAQHPTDNTVELQRELIDAAGVVVTLQTCLATVSDCETDSGWTTSIGSDDTTQFVAAAESVATATERIGSPVASLPAGVTEAVIAETDSERPEAENILCGLQLVGVNVKAFCWQRLPSDIGANLFQETLSAGEIFYQRLP